MEEERSVEAIGPFMSQETSAITLIPNSGERICSAENILGARGSQKEQ